MVCPRCGGNDCQVVNETYSEGKDYGLTKGCCGYVIFGPLGLLCGLCGKGRRTYSKQFWVCRDCGKKFRL